MSTPGEECEECNSVDALGRHDGLCTRARSLGLPYRAEGEEPIEEELDQNSAELAMPVDDPKGTINGVTTKPNVVTTDGPFKQSGALCVACLEYHVADTTDAVKIGKSLIHPDCKWQLDYPGLKAHEVIARLEDYGSDTGNGLGIPEVRKAILEEYDNAN